MTTLTLFRFGCGSSRNRLVQLTGRTQQAECRNIGVTLRLNQREPRFEQLLFLVQNVQRGANSDSQFFLGAIIRDFGSVDLTAGRLDRAQGRIITVPGLCDLSAHLALKQVNLLARLIAAQTRFADLALDQATRENGNPALRDGGNARVALFRIAVRLLDTSCADNADLWPVLRFGNRNGFVGSPLGMASGLNVRVTIKGDRAQLRPPSLAGAAQAVAGASRPA